MVAQNPHGQWQAAAFAQPAGGQLFHSCWRFWLNIDFAKSVQCAPGRTVRIVLVVDVHPLDP